MDIKVGPTGWERVTPLEEFPELTVEIRRLSLVEYLDFNEEHTDDNGKLAITFSGKNGREVFKQYCQNIEGLSVGDRPIKQPVDLLSDNTPPDGGAVVFIAACVSRFWDMNIASEEEIKNSDLPSVPVMDEAAGQGEPEE
jgi:hypothetical protein